MNPIFLTFGHLQQCKIYTQEAKKDKGQNRLKMSLITIEAAKFAKDVLDFAQVVLILSNLATLTLS